MAASNALMRTLVLYRHYPVIVTATVLLVAVTMALLFIQQHYLGVAIGELQLGLLAHIDEQTGQMNTSAAWAWASVLIGIAILRLFVGYISVIVAFIMGQRLLTKFAIVFSTVRRLDAAWRSEHDTGELITRVTRDADKMRDAAVIALRMVLEVGMMLCFGTALLWWYHWQLGACMGVRLRWRFCCCGGKPNY